MERRIIGDPSVFAVVYTPAFINEPRTLITGPCHLMINDMNYGPVDEDIYTLSWVADELRGFGGKERFFEEVPVLDTKKKMKACRNKMPESRRVFNVPGWMEYFRGVFFKQGDDVVIYWYLAPYVVKRKRFAGYPKGVQRAVVPIDTIWAVADEFSRQLAEVLQTQANSEEMKREYISGYAEEQDQAWVADKVRSLVGGKKNDW